MADYSQGNIEGDPFTIIEPQSSATVDTPPTWPFNSVTYTSSGHSFEMDDTPDRQRVKLYHRSGTFIEMHPNGQEVHKIYGNGYEFVIEDKKVKVYGNCVISVDGDAAIQVKGNAKTKVGKNLTTVVDGDIDLTSNKGSINLTANKINLNSKDSVSMSGSGMQVPSDFTISGDLNVGQRILAKGNIVTSSAVFSTAGFATPGSIFVGPAALATPLAVMATNQIFITASLFTAVVAGATTMQSGGMMTIGAGGTSTITSGGLMTIGSGGALGIGAAAAIGITAGGAVQVGAVGAVNISSASVSMQSAAVTMTGFLTVTGLITAADFFCLINPTFYSIHGHVPILTPPSIV